MVVRSEDSDFKNVAFTTSAYDDEEPKARRKRRNTTSKKQIKAVFEKSDDDEKDHKGIPTRTATKQSDVVAVIKTESIILKKKDNLPPVGQKVVSQQIIKLIPKPTGAIQAKTIKAVRTIQPLAVSNPSTTRKTKVNIMPKKKIMKLKILGKQKTQTAKTAMSIKPLPLTSSSKITLPKTRKNYKERKLRIYF